MTDAAKPAHFAAPSAEIGIVEGVASRLSEEGERIHFTAARVALQYDDGSVSYHFRQFVGSFEAGQLANRILASQGASGVRVRTDVLDATCWSEAMY